MIRSKSCFAARWAPAVPWVAPAGGLAAPARGACLTAVLLCLASCSLVSLKSPEKPLPPRELNARILTHEFAAHLISAIAETADEISGDTSDPAVRLNALRWKLAATGASVRAASQMAPMLSLLDTWALTVQMRDYLETGNGRSLFGSQQQQAVTLAAGLSGEAEQLAHRLTEPQEFTTDRQFIDLYVHEHPIESLEFARASVAVQWAQASGAQTRLVDTLGTVPEAMAQAGDLVRMYGDSLPSQMLWRAQLAAAQSGVSGEDVQVALRRLDERLARLSAAADATPDLVSGVARDFGRRFDVSWVEMLKALHTERAALAAAVSSERQAVTETVDAERVALAADTQRITSQVISEAGRELRRMVREVLLLAIALAIVVLGLPFAAGYMVGRARRGV